MPKLPTKLTMLKTLTAVIVLIFGTIHPASALSIIWDYTYDTNSFFTSERKAVLESVTSSFSNYEIDRAAIIPGGINTWNWQFSNPSGADTINIVDPTIGAGELRIFVGARNLGFNFLGFGGNVGYGGYGTTEWNNSITSTNTADAYKPFGGFITFDLTTNWYSGLENTVPFAQFDLYTVALHELGHVLGIGLYGAVNAWDANVNTGTNEYTGTIATGIYGGNIPLQGDWSHFTSGTEYDEDLFVMNPSISSGVRGAWTAPELGVLQDFGYIVVPEPSMTIAIVMGITVLLVGTRNYRKCHVSK